jgi:isochorismate synthase
MGETNTTSQTKLTYDSSIVEKDINSWAIWATSSNHNIAVFRKPGETAIMMIDSNPLKKVDKPIEELNKGFLFANYQGVLWHMEAEQLIDFNTSEHPNPSIKKNGLEKEWKYYTADNEQPTTSKEIYIATVLKGIETIESTELVKIVPTKIKLHNLADDFSITNSFVKLCDQYPNAFVSIVSTKEFGTWLTATPELLINVDENGIFETMALAGTQKNDPSIPPHEVAWVDKDIEEQAMVSRYIVNRFKEIRLREFVEKGPMTVRAANLTHLCTTYTVDTKATDFQNLGGVMLNLLHPTSAVCGMPKEPALKLIEDFEQHDRKFYTGYLGPVNLKNQTSLYVNLRCMELFKEKANIFAGAGVTAISDPEKEWNETELKFSTLLNIIG